MDTQQQRRLMGGVAVAALILAAMALSRTLRFGWHSFVVACSSALPFVIDNMVSLVNFVVLILVIVGLQHVRAELRKRAALVDRIERTIDEMNKPKDDDGQP